MLTMKVSVLSLKKKKHTTTFKLPASTKHLLRLIPVKYYFCLF